MKLNEPDKAFWVDRPTFVTGATGLVGGWLVRRLLDAGADVVTLARDWVPQSELVRARLIEQVKVVRGSDCAIVRRNFRIACRHHPLRKLLWRRRSKLEPHCAGHNSIRAAGPTARRTFRW